VGFTFRCVKISRSIYEQVYDLKFKYTVLLCITRTYIGWVYRAPETFAKENLKHRRKHPSKRFNTLKGKEKPEAILWTRAKGRMYNIICIYRGLSCASREMLYIQETAGKQLLYNSLISVRI